MIIGIGNDLLDMERFSRTMRHFDTHFQQKHFTKTEQEYCNSRPSTAVKIAAYGKRWAAKEAMAKALGTGIADGVYLKDIGITRADNGKPGIELTNGALARLQKLTPENMQANIHVTISDEMGLAQAVVVIDAY